MANRAWMYNGWHHDKIPDNEWIAETGRFLNHALFLPNVVLDGKIKCPCRICRNYVRETRDNVERYLFKNGFKEKYERWTEHGERFVANSSGAVQIHHACDYIDHMDDVVADIGNTLHQPMEEEPNPSAKAFYRMLNSADELVHETKRKRGQVCRSKGQEVAQNRGGSMPVCMAQQRMANSYGRENASVLDTYAAMKSGFKNLDEHGKPHGEIPPVAQNRIDNYVQTAKEIDPDLPDNWH